MGNIKSILIIEDSPDDAELYIRLLGKNNKVEVTHYSSAESAINAMSNKTYNFDAVLLDYNLPGVNGIEFLKRIYKNKITLNAPIIVVTGEGNETVAVNFLHLNVADYIVKGNISEDLLVQSISKARKKYEQFIASQEQQKALSLFAHTLAHDIKCSIGRIKSYSKLARKNPERVESILKIIEEDAYFLDEFVEKLYIYSSIGRNIDLKNEVDLRQVIKRSIDNLEIVIKENGAVISMEEKAIPPVYGSKIALVQLFQNIISNSIKYCSGRALIEITSQLAKHSLIISIKDNGIGIAKEACNDIFLPFVRLQNSIGVEGAGLGMAIVKSIVDQHNARIHIKHPNTGGTQFNIQFRI